MNVFECCIDSKIIRYPQLLQQRIFCPWYISSIEYDNAVIHKQKYCDMTFSDE